MTRARSAVDHLPAADQQEQQPHHEEDGADSEPERQDVRLGARLIVRTGPTHPPDQEHPSRSETDEAAGDRRQAPAPRQKPPPHEQTWEQRERVHQVGKAEQPAKPETQRKWRAWLRLSAPRLEAVAPSMRVHVGRVNESCLDAMARWC
jgi:hypothetical protein